MNEPRVITAECFGHPTDFLIETRRDHDSVTIKVTSHLPRLSFVGNELVSFPAPRYPWRTQEVPLE